MLINVNNLIYPTPHMEIFQFLINNKSLDWFPNQQKTLNMISLENNQG